MNLAGGLGDRPYQGRGVKTMPESEKDVADVIQAYRRRRERIVPLVLGGLAVVLVVVGVFMVVLWVTGDNPPAMPGFLASDTPPPTHTNTVRPPTITPVITVTLEPTDTPTPSGPQTYIVGEGDSLSSIADEYELGDRGVELIMSINNLRDPDAIFVGQELIIPEAGTELPTTTPLPATLQPGQEIEYSVQPGDSLESISDKFDSLVEEIVERNEIEDPNAIGVGQVLIIPVNIATRTPTLVPEDVTPTETEGA
jgi:LysM repeat protein